MKLIQRTILLLLPLLFVSTLFGAQADLLLPANSALVSTSVTSAKELKKAQKAEAKAVKKQMRKAMVKSVFSKKKKADDLDPILLVVLAILIPPLAVFLYDGDITNRFWLNLILTLLFFLPGMIHALLIVTGSI